MQPPEIGPHRYYTRRARQVQQHHIEAPANMADERRSRSPPADGEREAREMFRNNAVGQQQTAQILQQVLQSLQNMNQGVEGQQGNVARHERQERHVDDDAASAIGRRVRTRTPTVDRPLRPTFLPPPPEQGNDADEEFDEGEHNNFEDEVALFVDLYARLP